MKTLCYFLISSILSLQFFAYSKENNNFILQSPDDLIEIHISVNGTIDWMLKHEKDIVIAPSPISIKLYNGLHLGDNPEVVRTETETVYKTIKTPIYRKNEIIDHYNQLTLFFQNDFGLIFRAYNDGAAYRFFTSIDGQITIEWEQADLNFTENFKAFIPYLESRQDLYHSSFQSHKSYIHISEFDDERIAYTPLLIELKDGKKAAILEADLEDYPGRFLRINKETRQGFVSDYANYPIEEKQGGHNNLQSIVTKRAGFIANTIGTRKFPWRAIVISTDDKQLIDNDMVYKLAAHSQIEDISWIKPGQVVWEWWNGWNISGVDFRAGINTETYKYYIDFASENGIEYIQMDEGWSEGTDLIAIIPEIDLEDIIAYATKRNVGVLLWVGWDPLDKNMEKVFSHYADMGVKGFKIDFTNRDDQRVVNFHYRAARKAAEYNLLVNFHGTYPPTGLPRTYPNAINYEGVHGMEHHKWSEADERDQPRQNVMIPFTRMMAGPLDNTPGAMRNASRENFRAIYSMPMSQGTRCHQLAMYIMYDSPLVYLADNPTMYKREQESLDFITSIPTTFDKIIPLAGKVGEYVAIAKKNGESWYVAAMTNWDSRKLMLDFSFLPDGKYRAVIFSDGINADRDAMDYRRDVRTISQTDRIQVELAPGGGWAAIIQPMKE